MKKHGRLKKVGLIVLLGLLAIVIWSFASSIIYRPVFSSSARARHLVVISVDALNAQDYDKMKNLPNFKKVLDSGSYAKEAVGVYPSLTYPSHTSIITGTYPDKHGIYANEVNEPGIREQHWHWYKDEIKVPTLYDIAKKSNMTVASMFWPVTAGASIDYNMPEIWPVTDKESQIWLTLTNGSVLFAVDSELRYGSIRDGDKQPALDNYSTEVISNLIKSKQPNLVLLHLTELDHVRHKKGFSSPEANTALKNMDDRLGKIMQSVSDAGIYNDTAFIILGDHGFMDADYVIRLNTALAKEGLINVDATGNVLDWKAYSNYCDGSAQVYLKDPADTASKEKVLKLLNDLKDDPKSGIEAVYTKEQSKAMGVSGDFEFMVEAKQGYFFLNDWTGDLVIKIDKANIIEDDAYSYLATHGYDPEKPGYRTFFMACGAGIKKGAVIPSINIVDEGPTMAALLGLDMPGVDGRILDEILE